MKVLVKPETNLTTGEQLLELQCEQQSCGIDCGGVCICNTKSSWYTDDDSGEILF